MNVARKTLSAAMQAAFILAFSTAPPAAMAAREIEYDINAADGYEDFQASLAYGLMSFSEVLHDAKSLEPIAVVKSGLESPAFYLENSSLLFVDVPIEASSSACVAAHMSLPNIQDLRSSAAGNWVYELRSWDPDSIEIAPGCIFGERQEVVASIAGMRQIGGAAVNRLDGRIEELCSLA